MFEILFYCVRNIHKIHHSSMKFLELSDCLDISQAGDLMSTPYILQVRIRSDQNCIFYADIWEITICKQNLLTCVQQVKPCPFIQNIFFSP